MHKVMAAIIALLVIPTLAYGQTMAVSVDPDGTSGDTPFVQLFNVTTGVPFDEVIWVDTAGSDIKAAEFVVTDVAVEHPGVFRLNTTSWGNPITLDVPVPGEFVISAGECLPSSSQLEMVRITYGDFGGLLPGNEVLLTVRGFEPGDTQPSSFDGSPGFVDCADHPVPSVMGGTDGCETGSGLVFPDGSTVLNPAPIPCPAGIGSVGWMKACY